MYFEYSGVMYSIYIAYIAYILTIIIRVINTQHRAAEHQSPSLKPPVNMKNWVNCYTSPFTHTLSLHLSLSHTHPPSSLINQTYEVNL